MPAERQEIDPALLQQAADILRSGCLVAYPTDTVYGLAADPTNAEAVRKLSTVKQRDPEQPMPHLVADAAMAASAAAAVPEQALLLIEAFWPGALTIVMEKAPGYASAATDDTIGLRVPDHSVPRELARMFGGPITGTSANVAGGPEPLSAEDVRRFLGEAVDLVIDGGTCPGDRPSTVIDCTVDPLKILRVGAIMREEIEHVLEIELEAP